MNLIERLISVGDNDELIKEKINGILDESTPRRFNTEEFKKNIDMIKNTFKIVRVIKYNAKTIVIPSQEKWPTLRLKQ